MDLPPDERKKFLEKCLHDCESYVFIGPEKKGEKRFVTKIMKLKPPGFFKTVYKEEQVARNLLWLGLQKDNQSLAKIHHLRGIEVDGEPGLLIIQEHADGTQTYSNPRTLDPKTFIHFDDILFKPDGFSNIISTKEGLKVVDARMRESTFKKQKCPQGKCNCNWHDFVKKTASGFDPLPEGYALPQEIKKAYDPEANPWISQVEKEAEQINRGRTRR